MLHLYLQVQSETCCITAAKLYSRYQVLAGSWYCQLQSQGCKLSQSKHNARQHSPTRLTFVNVMHTFSPFHDFTAFLCKLYVQQTRAFTFSRCTSTSCGCLQDNKKIKSEAPYFELLTTELVASEDRIFNVSRFLPAIRYAQMTHCALSPCLHYFGQW